MENSSILTEKKERNANIDIIKLVSMFLVVVIHISGMGIGTTEHASGATHVFVKVVNAFSYCCIDVFAMVSGYLMCEKQKKANRLIRLWADVFFYSIAGFAVVFLISRDNTLTAIHALSYLFPIVSQKYWYMSIYFALYFMIPFYNKLIYALDKRTHAWILLIMLTGISVISTMLNRDSFNISGNISCSFAWISIMYFLGAYIKKYGLNLSKKKCFVLIVISEFLICASDLILVRYRTLFGNAIVLKKYSSFAVVALSIAVFVFVLNMKLKVGPKMSRVIKSFSVASLAVYLTHTHPDIFYRWIVNGFKGMAQLSLPFVVICIIGISLAITIGGCLIGMAQHKLFELLKIYKLCDVVAEKLMDIKRKIDAKLAV